MKTGRLRSRAFEGVLVLLGSVALVACRGADENETVYEEPEELRECKFGGVRRETDVCPVADQLGTYAVVVRRGRHTRGTVIVEHDGALDYDAELKFPIEAFARVEQDDSDCCTSVVAEMWPRLDNDPSLARDARHRIEMWVEGKGDDRAMTRIFHYPNWPSDADETWLDVIH